MFNLRRYFISAVILSNSAFAFAQADAAYEVDPNAKVLGQAGQVKIQKEFCDQNYSCDYVLYDAKGERQVLITNWSKTAHVYQFNSNLMGFKLGSTGGGHVLTIIDHKNHQKDYSNFLAINKSKTCFVTYESGLKNMPDSLVFYSVPDLRVHLVLNHKVPQFKQFTYPNSTNFEDNGDFSFNYNVKFEGEMDNQYVMIQKPCQPDYRVIMN